jgi:hypothetical protein
VPGLNADLHCCQCVRILVSTVCVFVCAVRSRRERESQHRLVTPFTPFPMGPYMYAPIYLPPHYHHDKR